MQTQFKLLDAEMHRKVFDTKEMGLETAQTRLRALGSQFASLAAETGKWQTVQKTVNDQTVQYTENLIKQKNAFNELKAARKSGLSQMAYQEQLRLRSAQVSTVGREANGNIRAQMMIPANAEKSLDTMANRAGFAASELKAASTQMINFGKNTQWAGRQLTVGFTVPLMAAGAATGYFAMKADQELTRIQKVYDTTTNSMLSNQEQQVAKEKELAQLRVDSMATASTAAKQYGAAMGDTLSVQGELAATGVRGRDLQAATNETMRLATLGEMDYQTAVKATISLQSVFNQNADELTKSFNYMNAVENQTSLSMQDFAEAIPIAAAPIKALGGDIQQLGTLMVAMKARGIDAAEGANAIKSAFNRIINPGKSVAEQFQRITGVSIADLVKETKGELIPTLQAIGQSVEHLDDLSRAQVLGKLFGTYQNTRINAMLTGITEDLNDADSQVGRAIDLANQSDEKLAAIADAELQRVQQSASGRLKRAVESIKVQLAEMGQGFLEMAVKVVEAGGKLLDFFQNLPGPVKGFLKVMVGIVAVTGPLVMLAGLATNLAGTFVKFGASIVMAATNFKLLNRDTVLAEKAAKVAESTMQKQVRTTESLTIAVQGLSSAFKEAARSQSLFASGQANEKAVAGLTGKGPQSDKARSWKNIERSKYLHSNRDEEVNNIIAGQGYTRDSSGRLRQKGKFVAEAPIRQAANAQVDAELKTLAADRKERLAILRTENNITRQQSEELRKAEAVERKRVANNRMLAASGSLFTAGLVAQLVPLGEAGSKTEKIKNDIAQWAMIAGTALPLVSNIGPAMTAIGTGLTAAGARAKTFGANLLTSGKSAFSLQNGLKGAGKAAFSLGGLINPWAGAFAAAAGGAFLLYKHLSSARKETEAINEDTSGLAEILGYTPSEGAKVDASGNVVKGINDEIREFNNAYPGFAEKMKGMSRWNQENMALQQGFKVIDTGGTVDQAKKAIKLALMASKEISEDEANKIILNLDFDKKRIENRLRTLTQSLKNAAEGADSGNGLIRNPWGDYGNSDAKTFGKNSASLLTEMIDSGDMETAKKQLDDFIKDINMKLGDVKGANGDDLAENIIKGFGQKMGASDKEIDTAVKDFRQRLMQASLLGNSDPKLSLSDLIQFSPDLKAEKKAEDGIKKLKAMVKANLFEAGNFLQLPLTTVINADPKTKERMMESLNLALQGKALTKEQKADLKQIEQITGLRLTGEQSILGTLAGQTTETSKQAENQAKIMSQINSQRTKLTNAIQKDIDGLDQSYDKRAQAMENAHNARMDAMDAAQRRREAAFDKAQARMENRQDREQHNFEKRWDKRINKVKKEEDMRQRIFDAERNRIKRLAELQNANINFNAALQTGNLDEAARIQNTQRASTEANQLDDLDARLGRSADNKINSLEKQRDEAQYKLKKHQDFEKQAFDATKRRYQDSVAAARAAAQRSYDYQKQALDREKTARKNNLQAALADLQAFKGKSLKEWNEYLQKTRDKYGLYGGASGKAFGDAAARWIRSKINAVGKEKDNEKSGGESAKRWFLGAGRYLKLSKKDLEKFAKNHWSTGYSGGLTVNHEGGFANGVKGRTGYPSKAAPFPSESLRLLKNDEYVVKGSAVRQYGADAMHAINSGKASIYAHHEGGFTAAPSLTRTFVNNALTRKLAYAKAKAVKKKIEGQDMGGLGGPINLKAVKGIDNRRTSIDGQAINASAKKKILAAQKALGVDFAVTQGSWSTRVGASGSTHAGAGAFDAVGNHTQRQVLALRKAGFAAWLRTPAQGPWPKHIHGIEAGNSQASASARGQVANLKAGGNGLGGRDDGPRKGVAWLRKGGTTKYDNTPAVLHKGETVLTDSLTQKFKKGIEEVASGANVEYNIPITIQGNATAADAKAIAKEVMKQIDLKESRKGRKR